MIQHEIIKDLQCEVSVRHLLNLKEPLPCTYINKPSDLLARLMCSRIPQLIWRLYRKDWVLKCLYLSMLKCLKLKYGLGVKNHNHKHQLWLNSPCPWLAFEQNTIIHSLSFNIGLTRFLQKKNMYCKSMQNRAWKGIRKEMHILARWS